MSVLKRYTIVAEGASGVGLHWDDVPEICDTEVLVRVTHSLVSPGTERHYISELRKIDDRLALGYCAVGVVIATGSLVEHVRCDDDVLAMGWNIATHSNYIRVPRKLVSKMDRSTKPEHAILATIGATAVHACDRAGLAEDDRALIVGMGLVGTMIALVAHAAGCQVWASDRDPALVEPALCWTPFGLDRPNEIKLRFSKIFLCIDSDVGEIFPRLVQLLDVNGNGRSRSRVVNVGRITGGLALSPALGNFDIINASRCGAGYRDDLYHHGLRDVSTVDGEARVDENLRRCLKIVSNSQGLLQRLDYRSYQLDEAIERYNSRGFFPAGINLISHASVG
ncbi:NADPH2:quinone reductase [Bradyrhizobium sp. USDA 4341]